MNKIRPFDPSHGVELQKVQKPKPLSQDPEKAAEQFESMLVKQMMDSMWSTVPKDGLLSGSNEESMYRDMLNEALSSSIAQGRGMGIKEVILKDINKLSKSK
jgi:flagellar protein FlgJ